VVEYMPCSAINTLTFRPKRPLDPRSGAVGHAGCPVPEMAGAGPSGPRRGERHRHPRPLPVPRRAAGDDRDDPVDPTPSRPMVMGFRIFEVGGFVTTRAQAAIQAELDNLRQRRSVGVRGSRKLGRGTGP
jgi:hypothetical protein